MNEGILSKAKNIVKRSKTNFNLDLEEENLDNENIKSVNRHISPDLSFKKLSPLSRRGTIVNNKLVDNRTSVNKKSKRNSITNNNLRKNTTMINDIKYVNEETLIKEDERLKLLLSKKIISVDPTIHSDLNDIEKTNNKNVLNEPEFKDFSLISHNSSKKTKIRNESYLGKSRLSLSIKKNNNSISDNLNSKKIDTKMSSKTSILSKYSISGSDKPDKFDFINNSKLIITRMKSLRVEDIEKEKRNAYEKINIPLKAITNNLILKNAFSDDKLFKEIIPNTKISSKFIKNNTSDIEVSKFNIRSSEKVNNYSNENQNSNNNEFPSEDKNNSVKSSNIKYDLELNADFIKKTNKTKTIKLSKSLHEGVLNNDEIEEEADEYIRNIYKVAKIYDSLEDSEEEANLNTNFVIMDDSYFKILWDLLILLFCIISIVVIPIRISFDSVQSNTISIILTIADILMILDNIINFFVPFVGKNEILITNSEMIMRNYLTSYFLIDFLSALPFSTILRVLKISNKYSKFKMIQQRYDQGKKIIKYLSLINLFRLFKSFSRYQKMNFIDENSRFKAFVYLFDFYFWFFLNVHLMSCLWIYIGKDEHYLGWVYRNNFNELSDIGIYIASLYYHCVTIFTVGYGDIIISTTNERLYTTLMMILGIIIYSYTVSSLGLFLSKEDTFTQKYNKNVDLLNSLKYQYDISDDVYRNLLRYLNYNKDNNTNERLKFFEDLPRSTLKNLLLTMHSEFISNQKFFKYSTNEDFILDVLIKLKPRKVYRNDILYYENEIVEEMFLIKRGVLSLCLPEEFKFTSFFHFRKSDFYGDLICLASDKNAFRLKVSSKYAEIFSIHKNDLLELSKKYPGAFQNIFNISHFNHLSLLQYNIYKQKRISELKFNNEPIHKKLNTTFSKRKSIRFNPIKKHRLIKNRSRRNSKYKKNKKQNVFTSSSESEKNEENKVVIESPCTDESRKLNESTENIFVKKKTFSDENDLQQKSQENLTLISNRGNDKCFNKNLKIKSQRFSIISENSERISQVDQSICKKNESFNGNYTFDNKEFSREIEITREKNIKNSDMDIFKVQNKSKHLTDNNYTSKKSFKNLLSDNIALPLKKVNNTNLLENNLFYVNKPLKSSDEINGFYDNLISDKESNNIFNIESFKKLNFKQIAERDENRQNDLLDMLKKKVSSNDIENNFPNSNHLPTKNQLISNNKLNISSKNMKFRKSIQVLGPNFNEFKSSNFNINDKENKQIEKTFSIKKKRKIIENKTLKINDYPIISDEEKGIISNIKKNKFKSETNLKSKSNVRKSIQLIDHKLREFKETNLNLNELESKDIEKSYSIKKKRNNIEKSLETLDTLNKNENRISKPILILDKLKDKNQKNHLNEKNNTNINQISENIVMDIKQVKNRFNSLNKQNEKTIKKRKSFDFNFDAVEKENTIIEEKQDSNKLKKALYLIKNDSYQSIKNLNPTKSPDIIQLIPFDMNSDKKINKFVKAEEIKKCGVKMIESFYKLAKSNNVEKEFLEVIFQKTKK